MKINFFIPCIPPKATSQQKGVMVIGGKPRFFKKKKVAQAENNLISLLRPHAPQRPFIGAVSVSIMWVYPWRAGETKTNRAKGRMPCDKRPDVDNLSKMMLDAMTTLGFWNDDGQISRLTFVKQWGTRSGIDVCVMDDV